MEMKNRNAIEKIVYEHIDNMLIAIDRKTDKPFWTPPHFAEYVTEIIINMFMTLIDLQRYLADEGIDPSDQLC